MDEIASGVWQAIKLIGSLDPEVRQIALFSVAGVRACVADGSVHSGALPAYGWRSAGSRGVGS